MIYTDSLHKIAYSTDASTFREMPKGVAYPADVQDVVDLVATAAKNGTFLIPRAGGTSIAGQVVGHGIVADVSRHWTRILEINAAEKWVRVEPGVIRDELNAALKPYGLFFSPETSTTSRCCVGGMFGNNSCGTHSLIYGSTRHHVLEAKGVLADGSVEVFKEYTIQELEQRFGPKFWASESHSLAGRIYSQLINWAADPQTVELLETNFPDKSLKRRSCGYAIDEVIEDLPHSINLCKLLAGSEGTLAFITEIKLSLDELPPAGRMVVCAHCDSLDKSFLANLTALKHSPAAVELIDGRILELSRQSASQSGNLFFVKGEPAALLVTELYGDDLDERAAALEKDLLGSGLVYDCTRVYGSEVAKVWDLRKAGLGVLSGMKGDAKPVGVIEDTAVAPERLPAYISDFREMLDELGLQCVFYGHISTGELHLRPILNLKTAEGRRLFREVAERTAMLVRKHKGSLSGEHGDGRLRGEFIPLMYGHEVYHMMEEVKLRWDPTGVFNMHKIVDTPPMDEFLRGSGITVSAVEEELSSDKTYFNWRAAFDECKVAGASPVRSQAHALLCSVEQCNGSADCRKTNLAGGTICPAYRVSGDETRSTRARANVIREILSRGTSSEAFEAIGRQGGSIFRNHELLKVLDSCLSCKGCRGECPSNVDLTRLKAELLQQSYDASHTPLRPLLVSRIAAFERLGAIVRPLYNYFATARWSSAIIKSVLHFAAERRIPTLSRSSMRSLVKKEMAAADTGKLRRKVYLFADEFTNRQEAELGLTFARLLIALGYAVEVPRHRESGRAAISKGCLKRAAAIAESNVDLLGDIVSEEEPLVGIEPSCILSFRDEYPDLVPAQKRQKARGLAANCLLFDEFLCREMAAGRIGRESFKSDEMRVFLHGHCHQKALVGVGKTVEALSLLSGAKVNVIPSGCCGMAGSFGYEKEHYRTSISIGEMVLFPAVRKAVDTATAGVPTFVLAPGTSCRQQILDGTGVRAAHPIELIYKYLK